MDKWQQDHIAENMMKLVKITPPNFPFEEDLMTSEIFLRYEMDYKEKQESHLHKFYLQAMSTHGGYDELIRLFLKHKITDASNLLLEGYRKNNKPIPEALMEINKSSSSIISYLKREILEQMSTKKCTELEKQTEGLHSIWFRVQDYETSLEELLGICKVDIQVFTDESTKTHTFLVRGITLEQVAEISDSAIIGECSKPSDLSKTRILIIEDTTDFKDICETTKCTVHLILFEYNRYFWIDSNKDVDTISKFLKHSPTICRSNAVEVVQMYKEINDSARKIIHEEPIPLLKETAAATPVPRSYIGRRFCSKRLLDKTCFTHESTETHVFLVRGTSLEELDEISGFEQTEVSGKQLYKITVRFIVLECEGDIERICKITKDPVHVIEYRDNKFYWVKSSRGSEFIRRFLKDDEESTISEDEFVTEIDTHSPPRLYDIVSEAAGMGATLLMASLAKKIQTPSQIALTINLEEFLLHLENTTVCEFKSPLDAFHSLLYYVCPGDCRRIIFEKSLEAERFKLVIFFDGYDKTRGQKRDLLNSFITCISQNEIMIYAVIIAIQAESEPLLQSMINLQSYKICPFNVPEQFQFIDDYWEENYPGNEKSPEYAVKCLNVLWEASTELGWRIAGCPMHNMAFAEYFGKRKFGDSKTTVEFDNLSFFEIYKYFVHARNSRLSENEQTLLQNFLNFTAIKLLFPEFVETFRPQFADIKAIPTEIIQLTTLLDKGSDNDIFKYRHRIFAEFFLTEFLVQNFPANPACVDLIIKILSSAIPNPSKPTICYFLNMHLKDSRINFSRHSYNLDSSEVCSALVACCRDDLWFCLEFLKRLLRHSRKSLQTWTELQDKCFQLMTNFKLTSPQNPKEEDTVNCHLPIFCPEIELKLLKTVVEFGVDINGVLKINGGTIIHIPDDCPGHFKNNYDDFILWALKMGFNRINDKDHSGRTPIMSYLQNFRNLTEEILNQFIKAGADFNISDDSGDTLLFYALHFNLNDSVIQTILDHGADINHENIFRRNAAHKLIHVKLESPEVLRKLKLLLSKGFMLLDTGDTNNFRPIHAVMKYVQNLDTELLELLKNFGADFNTSDKRGWSVLFYAIWNMQNEEIISKILENGCDLRHQNERNQNALHIAVLCNNLEAAKYLIEEKNFDTNLGDEDGRTPFQYCQLWKQKLHPLFPELFEAKGRPYILPEKSGSIMGDWKETYLVNKLPRLIEGTKISPEFMIAMQQGSFSEGEVNAVKHQPTPQESAAKLFRIVRTNANYYDEVTQLFRKFKMSEPLKILLDGYDLYKQPYPEGLKSFNTMIVGDSDSHGEVNVWTLLRLIRKSPTYPIFLKRWRNIAYSIGLYSAIIYRIRKELALESLELYEVPRRIIFEWMAQQGKNAKLNKFVDALNENGLAELADYIEEQLCYKKTPYPSASELKMDQ